MIFINCLRQYNMYNEIQSPAQVPVKYVSVQCRGGGGPLSRHSTVYLNEKLCVLVQICSEAIRASCKPWQREIEMCAHWVAAGPDGSVRELLA